MTGVLINLAGLGAITAWVMLRTPLKLLVVASVGALVLGLV